MDKRPIGVFDSGLGGLTVLEKLLDRMPKENYIYLADTKRAPYGGQSPQAILSYTRQIVDYFISQDVKAIVIACNTAASYGYEHVVEKYDLPIISVLKGGADSVLEKDKSLLVFATEATVRSSSYKKAIEERFDKRQVYQVACPKIVPLIEAGAGDEAREKELVKTYVDQALTYDFDTVILGCTHYPIWGKYFKEFLPAKTRIIDPAIETALSTEKVLRSRGLLNENEGPGQVEYRTTGNDNQFKKNLSNVFKIESKNITKIKL